MMTLTKQQMKERDEHLEKLNNGTFFKTDSRDHEYYYKVSDDGSLRIGHQAYINFKPVFKDGDDGFYLARQKKLVRFANENKSWFQIDDRRNTWHWP